jgi:hypothetical protein
MGQTVDIASALRKAYKAKGWTARDISVRSDLYSMGSSIRIRVKSARVNVNEAREMAEECESVRRCEYTGEILSGGNRYVDFSVEEQARVEIGAPYRAAAAAAIARVQAPGFDRSHLIEIEGTRFLVGLGQAGGLELRSLDGGRPHWLPDGEAGVTVAAFVATVGIHA